MLRISDDVDRNDPDDVMTYFITEDTEMPIVLDHTPRDGAWLVGLNDAVSVTLNKPVNTHTVDASSFSVFDPAGPVPGFIGFGAGGDSLVTFSPAAPYRAGVRHTVVLTSHIQDNIGNPIAEISWQFVTGVFDTLDYEGGKITWDGFELMLPPGAVESAREIGLGKIPPDALIVPPELIFTGIAYDMTSVNLDRPAVMTIDVPDSVVVDFGPIEQLGFMFFDSGFDQWVPLGGTATGHKLATAVRKLGRYGVFKVNSEQQAPTLFGSLALIPRVINPRRGGVDGELNISFTLSQAAGVVAKIYNMQGRLVSTVRDGAAMSGGRQLLSWDGRAGDGDYVSDGLYVVVLEAEGQTARATFVVVNN
jgi:hypothetical protein